MPGLDDLIDELLSHLWATSPNVATMLGVDGYHDRSPDLSAAEVARRERADDDFEARFSALDDGALTPDERVDRDLVLATLRGRAIMRDWQAWRREPERYLSPALMGVFSLFLRRPLPEPELVAAASRRLRAVPSLLDEGRRNLDPSLASTVMVDRGLRQCRAAVRYVRELVPAEVDEGPLRDELAAAGGEAAGAFDAFATWLEALQGRVDGEWAIGEGRYSALLRDKELLAVDAAALRARGEAIYDELDAELRGLARAWRGTDDWRALVDELGEDRPTTVEDMRDGYRRWTGAARRFLVERELVTFPEGESCEVVPSPAFQRPVLAVASYFAPPAFGPSLAGRFNVPYPPDGTPPDEVAKRLADNNFASMPTTSVHEAYPGHHWHYVRMQSTARPVRRVFVTPYYNEGWALYAELMMREQGFFAEPAHELFHLEARIFRAARIVADTSLHCGDMTVDEAVAFMHAKTKLTEPVARAEVARYCAWPTQAASYLTGSLEIERIRDRWRAERRGDLRRFHDTICGAGSLPSALAERAVLGS